MVRSAALLILIGGTFAAGPAVGPAMGQSNPIFDPIPRPPADVPNGGVQPQRPFFQAPFQAPERPQPPPPPPQSALPPPPPAQAARAPSGVQSQPLPPPPGATTVEPAAPSARAVPGPANPPPQPADTSPQSDDTVVTETPTQKIENGRAVFAGLDKITGRIISFDAAIGETVQFGALQVTARACYTRPPTEASNTDAFVEVDEVTLQGEIKRIFTGWMFASSPGLHAVEHPIYDIWVTDCASPKIQVAEPAPAASPASNPPPAPQRQRQPPPRRQQPAPQAAPAFPAQPR